MCRRLSLSLWFSPVFLKAQNSSRARRPQFYSSLEWHRSDLALWESDCDGSHGQFEISRLKSVTSAEAEWIRFGTLGLFTISGLHYCGSEPESKVAVKVPAGRASLGQLKQSCWVLIWKSHDWHQTGCFPLMAPRVSPSSSEHECLCYESPHSKHSALGLTVSHLVLKSCTWTSMQINGRIALHTRAI